MSEAAVARTHRSLYFPPVILSEGNALSVLSVASCGHLPGAQLGKGKQLVLLTSPLSWAVRRKRKLSFVSLLCDGGGSPGGLAAGVQGAVAGHEAAGVSLDAVRAEQGANGKVHDEDCVGERGELHPSGVREWSLW